ncbi:Hydroxymethylpyrimidine/phosphomethylpyrimidine kinase [Komagataella phaffii CBS 7435]|uniref:Protein with similarity to hydroxymethylpyrimidine phosphate kinases n=2 Tax=Komagataella phaffii TaxID=460519 RepID=C4QXJ6_KOMPG|nr:uncharacterized protein PAS_chr1-4_0141 [Komagataella phaffii GS115]AOA60855.1 GQ67_02046T0 [Komagataella phaffii]CAH2446783.1 Hydroxymethylpyrimidine/phosphomethylpyrimidine kinase [Komagataella phaffii CBS 7435]AOA66654.1 GQ68_02061T0 [Komagataella phaffii GS115]CAY67969.1 Protein with similarity to hydroxymethylpyrimidine phosphate kinases [Komagataella phaffii GS115]CCA37043.1 Hydroxymethylpyrimidine/phosphomethylpyrimidine kinase [Komagataella phaffii CBS 7435]
MSVATENTVVIDLRSIPGYEPVPLTVRVPTVLTLAGSDPSGGAGIEADIKTISAFHCLGLSAINALTAQNTTGVKNVLQTDERFLTQLLQALFEDMRIDAIKTGMMTSKAVKLLPFYLDKFHRGKPLVIDPVLSSTSGFDLGKLDVLKSSISTFFAKATVITPNFIEAKKIMCAIQGISFDTFDLPVNGINDLKALAKFLQQNIGCQSVLVKGGHIPWDEDFRPSDITGKPPRYLTEVLYEQSGDVTVFKSDFNRSKFTHGTGCTLASAMAANLARGLSISESVQLSISFVQNSIKYADKSLGSGTGYGPMNHLYNISTPVCLGVTKSNLPFNEGHFFDHLINYPSIAPWWKRYTQHDFIKLMATGALSQKSFRHFLKQGKLYLEVYTKIYAKTVALAPSLDQLQSNTIVLKDCVRELALLGDRLKLLGVDASNIKMSPACKDYTEYLMSVASSTDDWLTINILLAPCLHGYHHATKWALQFVGDQPSENWNLKWLNDYVSDWYVDSCVKGRKVLEKNALELQSDEQLSTLIDIFEQGTVLECKFWDEALLMGQDKL